MGSSPGSTIPSDDPTSSGAPRWASEEALLRGGSDGAGRGETKREPPLGDPDERVDLVDLAEAARRALETVGDELRLRCRIVEDLAPVPLVRASEEACVQVFLSLLCDARDALPDDDGAVNTVVVRTWTEAGRACAEVADTGRGTPRAEQERVFGPLFRTVEDLGGSAQLASEVGVGTRVRFDLPAADARPVDPAPALATAQKRRLLVVDDEPMVLSTLARFLSTHFEVVTAADGLAAQHVLQTDPAFDAVLCDVTMPRMSGVTLHRWMRDARPALARRLMFMTGGVFRPEDQRYLDETDRPLVAKPFDLRRLVRELQAFVEEQD